MLCHPAPADTAADAADAAAAVSADVSGVVAADSFLLLHVYYW
jgi:hypothetical protein